MNTLASHMRRPGLSQRLLPLLTALVLACALFAFSGKAEAMKIQEVILKAMAGKLKW